MEQRLKAGTFSFYTTMAVIGPYFPLYFQSKGYSSLQLGLLYSTGPLMGIAATLLMGILSYRLQLIKKMIVVILLGQLLCLLALNRIDSFSVLVTVMLAFYFCQSPIIPLNDSMLLHHLKERGGNYASYRVWASIGFASGVLVFGMLIEKYGLPIVPWLGIATIGISLVCVSLLQERRRSAAGLRFGQSSGSLVSAPFLLFMTMVLLMSVAHRMNDAFLSLFIQSAGGGQQLVGVTMLVASGFEIPVFFLLARYGHRFRQTALLTFASAVYTIRFAALGFVKEPAAVIALQALHSLSFGIFIYAAVSYMKLIVPDELRSTGQALFSIVWAGFAGIAAGLIGGYAFDHFGPHAVYRIAAVFSMASLVGFFAAFGILNRQQTAIEADGALWSKAHVQPQKRTRQEANPS
ncbi:MFS transporter [Paenibacillus allorhizosphaerae]|uniref:3-phenylpropionic acid transporter n=1 Tax=Paenibacillus allorhizosphaerae TaxID=2849866 RepID=A0ABM8VDA4_9BACL|nr:MFS transporter [Paenibacillus allorhizosphaerae]CAG7626933.1 putative 3-phenylpropionic acid transporter [Paenibacillus allorhizosphaerae]